MRPLTFEMLSLLVAAAAATACGGRAVDDDASPSASGSSSGASSSGGTSRGGETNDGQPGASSSGGVATFSDCGPITTNVQEVDESLCEPQLVSQMSYSPVSKCGDTVCQWSVAIPCGADGGAPDGGADADGGDASTPWDFCREVCAKTQPAKANAGPSILCNTRSDGNTTYVSCGGCGVGRPPSGFVPRDVVAPSEEAAWLARMAQLEAASVEAFDALHDDLEKHGAPESLLRLVRIAAKDEVRHAALAREQAERRGAIVPEVDIQVARGRSLEELAIENAREGCIEETFGAVLARIQAERATDPDLRDMLERIAHDELGHAFLSWRVAEWLDGRIADEARARVREARVEKLASLMRAVPHEARGALAAITPALS